MAKTDFTFVGTPHDPYSISGSDPYSSTGNARLAAWYNLDRGNVVTAGPNSIAQSNNDRGEKIDFVRDLSGNSKTAESYRHLRNWNVHKPIVTGSEVTTSNDPQLTGGDGLRYIMGSQNNHVDFSIAMSNLPSETRADTLLSTAAINDYGHWVSASKNDDGSFLHDRYNMLQKDRGGNGYTLFSTGKQTDQNHDVSIFEYANINLLAYPYALQRGSNSNYTRMLGTFCLFMEADLNYNPGNNAHAFGVAWETRNSDANNSMHLNYWGAGMGSNITKPTNEQPLTWIRSNKIYALEQFHPVACRFDSTGLHSEGTGSFNVEMFVNGHMTTNLSKSWDDGQAPRMISDATGITVGNPSLQGDYLSMAGYYTTSNEMTDPTIHHGWLEACVFDDALSDIRMQQIQKYFAERINSTMSGSDGGTGLEYLSMFENGGEGGAVARTSITGSSPRGPLSNANGGTYHREYKQLPTSSATPLIQYETAGGAFVKSTKESGEFYRIPSTKATSIRMWVRISGHQHDTNNDGVQVALVAKATSQWGHKLDNIKGYAFKFGTFENGTKNGTAPAFRISARNSERWFDGNAGAICNDTTVTNGNITADVDTWFKMRLDVIPSSHNYDLIKCYVLDNGDGTTWRQMGTTQTIDLLDDRYRAAADYTDQLRRQDTPPGIHNGYWVSMKTTDGKQMNHTKVYVEGFEILTDTV